MSTDRPGTGAEAVATARETATRHPNTTEAYAAALTAWADQHGAHVRLPDGTWHNPPHDRR